jgi:Uma2 family endonuclease
MSHSAADRPERFSYADLLRWPEDERWELYDGVPQAMSPAPATVHQRFVGELHRQIANFLVGHPCQVFMAPFDVRLAPQSAPANQVHTVVQPDLVVLCDLDGLDERGYQGAPDWVIEVLSPSTSAHDQITKLALYEAHGVRCYWLVHPTDGIVTVYTQSAADEGFGRPVISETKGSLVCTALDGLVIDWESLRGT